jgi:formylmethanofuran dehydrogenase subunit A
MIDPTAELRDLRLELHDHDEQYRGLAKAAARLEADYRHHRALKIEALRSTGLAVGMCEHGADADVEVYALNRSRLDAAADASALKVHLDGLREQIAALRTEVKQSRGEDD